VNVSSIYRKLFQFFLIVAYGALFWWLLRFLEVDACLDAGGAIDVETGNCVGARSGEYLSLLERPWQFWIFSLLVPAIPAVIFRFFGSKVLRSESRAVPNQ
jgi:hypothetical protein